MVILFVCLSHESLQAASIFTDRSLSLPRAYHTATLLPSGKVLVAGGFNESSGVLTGAELYDPTQGKWISTGSLNVSRSHHTATLLAGGEVLVIGGEGTNGVLASCELYDPVTEKWTVTGSLEIARDLHTATLLQNGQVLVTGGRAMDGSILSSTELYDPANRSWVSTIGALNAARSEHSASLLSGGFVLVAGGIGTNGVLSTSEIYDTGTRKWIATGGEMNTGRFGHTATMIIDGRILVAGGEGSSGNILASAELYDPRFDLWRTSSTALTIAREHQTATRLPNGQVLLTGGYNYGNGRLASTELYNYPLPLSWIASTNALADAREGHTSTLLPNGQVLIVGGIGDNGTLSTVERYDPAAAGWTTSNPMPTACANQTATLLANGLLLVTGGSYQTNTELFEPGNQSWTSTGPLNFPRSFHTATLLPNGTVLIAGGAPDIFNSHSTAEIYSPLNGQCSLTSSMNDNHEFHTATLLPNGKVLVAGGATSTAELYDPTSRKWTRTGSMNSIRSFHTATLLPNGKVLVAGGQGVFLGFYLSSAEIYDPISGAWTFTGTMTNAHCYHSATLLPNGQVLIASGDASGMACELYNPATETWTPTGPLNIGRNGGHTATLLLNGQVLLDGGFDSGNNAELYDPSLGTWGLLTSKSSARADHVATLLPNGTVVVEGGFGIANSLLSSAEIFDPGLNFSRSWRPIIGVMPPSVILTSNILMSGTGFRGISPASSGNTQDSPSDFPIVQLRSVESGQSLVLRPTNWTATSFSSSAVTNFPPGNALVTVFANGIPSQSAFTLVSKANALIILTNLNQVYDGAIKSVGAQTMPDGLAVSFTYNGGADRPTAAGSYTVVGTINDPNYQGSTTNILIVSPAVAAVVLDNLAQVYNGTPKTVSVSTAPPELSVALTYNGSTNAPSDAGTYIVVGTVKDPNGVGSVTNLLIISPATAAITFENLLQTFDGTPKKVSVATTPPGLSVDVTYNGSPNPPRAVGRYTVVGTVNDPNGQGIAIDTLIIGKAAGEITLGGLLQTYDGTPKHVTVSTTPPGLVVAVTYNGLSNLPVNVGSYTVVVTVNDPIFQAIAINTLVIKKAMAAVALTNLTQTYDGNPKTAAATTFPPGLAVVLAYNGVTSPPTNAGTYTVIGTINDPVYQGIGDGLLVIAKAAASITLSNLSQTFDGNPKTITATTTPSGLDVNLTYDGAPDAPTNEGNYTVIGTINDTNYAGATTNILVIGSPILLSSTLLANDVLQFTFAQTPGASFSVLATTNVMLPASNWIVLGVPVENPPGNFTFRDSAAPSGRRFYRVRSN